MILPSIDLMGGQAVQLVGGRDKALDAGDPLPIAKRFAVAGEIAVVDLDAALGSGDNRVLVEELVRRHPCRVGGGIRDAETALGWLDLGASSVVLGTAARPEVLRQLPSSRVIAALDAVDGEVVVRGWRERTGQTVEQRMRELRGLCGGFLVTFVEREGRMQGFDLGRAEALVQAASPARVTIAGGVTTAEDVADLHRIGADAQVGMALYTEKLDLGDAISAPLRSERADGLWPTVVADEHGVALGLAWSSADSVRRAVAERRGIYHSRSRGLWVKGETSGAVQELLEVAVDCDADALRFTVRQAEPGFCHRGTRTCWGEDAGIGRLARRLMQRVSSSPPGSYTRRLLEDPALLASKLREEAAELAAAEDAERAAHEAADVFYFALVAATRNGATLGQVERQLDRRELRVRRRPGDAKEDA